MKRSLKAWLAAASIVALASLMLTASASADVPRYQLQHGDITVVWNGGLVHEFTVDLNPCDGSFTGTGESIQGALHIDETVTGHLTATSFDFYSTYDNPLPAAVVPPGMSANYWWSYAGLRTGGFGNSAWNEHFSVNGMVFNMTTTSDYKNHGQYVKEKGSDEAHSCIGMPIVSSPYQFDTTGTINPASSTGTNVALPIAGTYRIDLFGTWQNGPWWLVDAEYVQQGSNGGGTWDGIVGHQGTPNGTLTWLQGWPTLTNDFGDVKVNGNFVDWGAYNSTHAYSYATALTSTTLNLAVYDTLYTDNVGALDYAVTYVGP